MEYDRTPGRNRARPDDHNGSFSRRTEETGYGLHPERVRQQQRPSGYGDHPQRRQQQTSAYGDHPDRRQQQSYGDHPERRHQQPSGYGDHRQQASSYGEHVARRQQESGYGEHVDRRQQGSGYGEHFDRRSQSTSGRYGDHPERRPSAEFRDRETHSRSQERPESHRRSESLGDRSGSRGEDYSRREMSGGRDDWGRGDRGRDDRDNRYGNRGERGEFGNRGERGGFGNRGDGNGFGNRGGFGNGGERDNRDVNSFGRDRGRGFDGRGRGRGRGFGDRGRGSNGRGFGGAPNAAEPMGEAPWANKGEKRKRVPQGENGQDREKRPFDATKGIDANRPPRRRRPDPAADYAVAVYDGDSAGKRGTVGRPVEIRTNAFNIAFKTGMLYQYHVAFSLEEDRTNVKKGIFYGSMTEFNFPMLFDGSVLWTCRPLFEPEEKQKVFTSSRKSKDGEPEQCDITVTLISYSRLPAQEERRVFNVIVQKTLHALQLEKWDRCYFDYKGAFYLSNGLIVVWPGYRTNVREQQSEGLALCATITHKFMRNQTVYEQIRRMKTKDINEIKRELVGLVVMTTYNRKRYRIDDITKDMTAGDSFPLKDGTMRGFAEHIELRYGAETKDLNQWLLVSKPKEKDIRGGKLDSVLLIPEHCVVCGLDNDLKNNPHLRKEIKALNKDPGSSVRVLEQFSERIHQDKGANKVLKDWDVNMDSNLLSIKGRQLNVEPVEVGQSRPVSYQENNPDWGGAMRDSMFRAKSIERWALVYPSREEHNVRSFINALMRVAQKLNISITPPKYVPIEQDRRVDHYIDAIDKEVAPRNPDMVVTIVPSDRDDHYSTIKKYCYTPNGNQKPLNNQVITVSKVIKDSKKHMTCATKILLQMATKQGGQPWTLRDLKATLKGTMVIGFDSYRDSKDKSRGYGAVVASLDMDFGRYFSAVAEYKYDDDDLSDKLLVLIQEAIEKFRAWNENFLPRRIVFYRDGVGDGQLKAVVENEVNKLKDKLSELYTGDVRPSLTFIVVSKKINQRFYREDQRYRYANPNAGTVIDDVVTLPLWYDFFLISQSVRQGTVNPTRYNVLLDESSMSPDQVQKMTYQMCHLYFNWCGTIRVPAVNQYAHKLAFLVAEKLHRLPHLDLNTLLYYI